MTVRQPLNLLLSVLLALAVSTAARATEPNNLPGQATELPSPTRRITDSLDGNSGRPDTLLGHYNPSFTTRFGSDDNSSSAGNGKASQMLGVPILPGGGAYFRVTGAPDTMFVKNHTQLGRYKISFDVRDPNGNLVPSKSFVEYEEVSPHELDNVWLNPSPSPDPGNLLWTGFTVDVRVDNIVGPGTGDSLDFFLFTGFQPFETFTAELSDLAFDGLVGWYTAPNVLAGVSDPLALVPTISGFANSDGEVLLGVSGANDVTFLGEHAEVGTYTLSIVPEPTSVVSLAMGAGICGWYWTRTRRSKQRSRGPAR